MRANIGQSRSNGNVVRLASKARHRRRILVVRFEAVQDETSPLRKSSSRNHKSLPSSFFLASSNLLSNFSSVFPLTPIMTIYCNDTKRTDSIENFPQGMWKKLKNIKEPSKVRKVNCFSNNKRHKPIKIVKHIVSH